MTVVRLPNAFILSHLSLLLLCTFTLAKHPPAEAPHSPPHHHHHHHQHHLPTPPPAHPPVKPPPPYHHTPPAHPPVKPPPPYHHTPPAHPPVKPPPPHHHTPPAHPPVKPPTPHHHTPPAHPPMKPPPPHPPVKPPTPGHIPRKLVAIQGVVYCKPCKTVQTLKGASPLSGAVVRLQCGKNHTEHRFVPKAHTDKNGYFVFHPTGITAAAVPKCKVFLVSSPEAKCRVPTNFNRGSSGAVPIASRTPPAKPTPFQFFNVGPFAFESSDKKSPCHY